MRVTASAIAVLVLTALSASAQDALPLAEAIARARTANPQIQALAAAEQAAAARVDAARAGSRPRVDVVESWQRGDGPLYAFGALLGARRVAPDDLSPARLNDPGATTLYRTGLIVRQIVFDGGAVARATEIARLGLQATEVTTEGETQHITLAVVQSYGTALAADRLAGTLRSALAAAESDEARVGSRRDAGLATDADALALAVQVAEVRARLVRAEADADVARARLNRLMGVPLATRYALQEPPVPSLEAAADDTLVRQALADRPETRAASLQVSIATAARRAAAAALLPSVGVQAGYEWTGIDVADRRAAWLAGVEVRWNLFAGGADRARQREAAAQVTHAEHLMEASRAAVEESVHAAARLLDAARARDDLGQIAAGQAREAERVIRERYLAGLATVTDLLRASTATIDAEARAASSRIDVITAVAVLQHAAGQPVGTP